jgi:hypothetical protein
MDFSSGLAPYTGYSEKEWAELKERERSRPGLTLEELELQRKQDAARHSHKEMFVKGFSIEWRTFDGKPLDNATSHPNPRGGPSAAMSVQLLNETIQNRPLPIMLDGKEIGSVTLTFGEHRVVSGITY